MPIARILRFAALCVAVAVLPAQAQELGLPRSNILTISPEAMFAGSLFGKRVTAEIEEAGRALAAENRRIEGQLVEEEKSLTEQRAGMEPQAFREKANAFDQKAQRLRREQQEKVVQLNQRGENARRGFLAAARPVLQQIMQEAGAGIILERSDVFLSSDDTDVTGIAIERIDAAIGDGTLGRPKEE